jgi:hypothetical protein
MMMRRSIIQQRRRRRKRRRRRRRRRRFQHTKHFRECLWYGICIHRHVYDYNTYREHLASLCAQAII